MGWLYVFEKSMQENSLHFKVYSADYYKNIICPQNRYTDTFIGYDEQKLTLSEK